MEHVYIRRKSRLEAGRTLKKGFRKVSSVSMPEQLPPGRYVIFGRLPNNFSISPGHRGRSVPFFFIPFTCVFSAASVFFLFFISVGVSIALGRVCRSVSYL